MIDKISKNLKIIQSIVHRDKIAIDIGIDNFIVTSNFDKNNPFFKWSSKKYDELFKKLLNGEKVKFNADISETRNVDAMKFQFVYIVIEFISSKSKNKELNKLLFQSTVQLTHSGISNYKFKDSIYKLRFSNDRGSQLELSYAYEPYETVEKFDSIPQYKHVNSVYTKLAKEEPLLSPYTLWEIEIKPIIKDDKILKLYESSGIEMVISLCGKGKYIKNEYLSKYNLTSCEKIENPVPNPYRSTTWTLTSYSQRINFFKFHLFYLLAYIYLFN